MEGDTDAIEEDALSSEQMWHMHEKIDGNRDGKASLAEVMTFSKAMRAEIVKRDVQIISDEMDHNKDGKLSLDELLKDMDQWGEADEEDEKEASQRRALESEKFQAADVNGDGFLTADELPVLFYPGTKDAVLAISVAATLKRKDGNADGRLTLNEFWQGDPFDCEELPISEEEEAEFRKLDLDDSGQLDLEELKQWESGDFHREEAMRRLLDVADMDSDMHVTAEELDDARKRIASSDAQYHLVEWVEHYEF